MISETLLNQTYETIYNLVKGNNLKEDSIENLGDILFLLNEDIEYYISNRRSLNNTYRNVWEESIRRRLLYFPNEVLERFTFEKGETRGGGTAPPGPN